MSRTDWKWIFLIPIILLGWLKLIQIVGIMNFVAFVIGIAVGWILCKMGSYS